MPASEPGAEVEARAGAAGGGGEGGRWGRALARLGLRSWRLTDVARAVLSGALAVMLVKVTGAGLKYGVEIAYARWMGPAEYGALAYAVGWAELLSIPASLGLVTASLRFVPQYAARGAHGRLRGYLARGQQLALAGGVAVALPAMALAWALAPAAARGPLVVGLACTVPLALVRVQSAMLRGFKRVATSYVGLLVVAPAGGLAAAYALATATGARPSLAATSALGGVLVAVVAGQALALRAAMPRAARYAEAAPQTRRWLAVAWPLLVVSGFTVLLDRADLLMVGALEGVADAGRYNAATRTARLISFLLTALSAMAVPLMSEAWAAGDRTRLEGVMRTVIGWVFWPSLALSVALIAFGKAVLGLFGDGFAAAYGALVLLTLGQLANAATGPVVYLLGITGHERLTARLSVGAAVFNLAANVVLIRALGFVGAAWATALTMAAWNLGAAYWVRRRVGVSVFRVWAQMLRLAPAPPPSGDEKA